MVSIPTFNPSLDDSDDRAVKADDTRNRAWAFLLRLLEEAEKRLPDNMAVFRQMSFFSPARILSPKPPKFAEMPFVQCILGNEDLFELEEQWRQVAEVAWAEAGQFRTLGEVPTDPVLFWSGVLGYSAGDHPDSVEDDRTAEAADQSKEKIFLKLATFVLGRFTIAHSTAAVERTFSIVSCVKSKVRNRMLVETLEAVLRVRTYLSNRGRCCKNFEPTTAMLNLFNNEMYLKPKPVLTQEEEQAEAELRCTEYEIQACFPLI